MITPAKNKTSWGWGLVNDAQYIIDPERIGTLGGVDLSNPYARITPAMGASAQDFSFGKSIFDVMDGNPDGDSVSGIAIKSYDDETGNRRGRDKDKDEGGLSWDDVQDARERMRAEIENISLRDGKFSIFGMEIDEADMDAAVKDTLSNFDAFAAKHNLTGQDKDQFQQWLLYYDSLPEGDPRKADAMRNMTRINPGGARAIAEDANAFQGGRLANEVTREETVDARAAEAAPTDDWSAQQTDFAEANGYTEAEAVDFGDRALEIGRGTSVVGSTDLASSFEASFSAAPEFNAQASGNVQLAQAELQQTSPNQSGPAVVTL